ncbi:tRNA(fMet)-specific endonuclease VapC [Acaryochloris thomasi RCC1774]|uniref:tRNA(fMet)-specific endonuclease VapC n=1 Tax=Acaryochloris thomasi RCC1774 TaxID=1764569 RepID=A0A2W1JJP6_9CYAN|nr:type II toxin-antitoxin system VapC family toxin [Acaryochloris thomasi]PZD73629.1 tRNA(fMet)-specific endonuclease VapC [Acaryochloris thomasi RCC1774]
MTAAVFLLDTNIFSEATKLQPNPQVLEKLKQNRSEIATASVVLHELLFGCYRLPRSKRRQKLEDYAMTSVSRTLQIFSYDDSAAKCHAAERSRLATIGRTPPYIDGQIAAIAIINNLTLVTRNESDYQDFQRLKIENWFR